MMRRREFLRSTGLAILGGVAGGPRWVRAASEPPLRSLQELSRRPENLATPVEWFDRLLTPTDVFFVRSHFGAPALQAGRRLRIEGLVARPLDLGVEELEKLPQTTLTVVLQCAGNGRALQEPRVPGVQWVHGAMGQAEWSGVRLRDLLERAELSPEAAHVGVKGADLPAKPSVPAFHRSLPRERALDPTTLVALRMNGEPLTHAHGAPFRLVVPGWAGNHWMKWLTTLSPQREEAEGFYMRTGYRLPRTEVAPGTSVPPEATAPLTTFPLKSVIARPADGGRAPRGTQEIAGVAFSGEASIAGVEVSLDGGRSWRKAKLEGEPGIGRWQVFRLHFKAAPGRYRATVRAIDSRGARQPERAAWNPSGYFWNGWHSVEWEVE